MNTITLSNDSTETAMTTLADCFPRGSSVYWGTHGDWILAYGIHRESDTLERSNYAAMLALLGGKESETVQIERANCSLVGWREYLIVDPSDTAKVEIVRKTREDLEDYPVIDEMAWSELEQEEYWEAFTRDARSEFRSYLRDFQLQDTTLDRLDAVPDDKLDILSNWFENRILSGEYQTDGYPCFDNAFRDASREDVARLFRAIHSGQAEERR